MICMIYKETLMAFILIKFVFNFTEKYNFFILEILAFECYHFYSGCNRRRLISHCILWCRKRQYCDEGWVHSNEVESILQYISLHQVGGAIHYMGKSTKLGYKLGVPHPHYGKPSVLYRKKSETHKNWNWMHLINDIFESKVTSNKKLFCHIIAFNYSIWKRFFLLRKK